MAAKAGLDQALVRELSGHSMRVGAAQDMMASGIWHIRPTVHMRRLSWSQLVSKESVLGQIVTGGKRYSGLRAPIPKTLSAAIGPTLPHSRPGAGHRGCVPSPPRRTPSRGSSPTKRQDWHQRPCVAAWQESERFTA